MILNRTPKLKCQRFLLLAQTQRPASQGSLLHAPSLLLYLSNWGVKMQQTSMIGASWALDDLLTTSITVNLLVYIFHAINGQLQRNTAAI